MPFQVVYNVGGDLDNVRRVKKVDAVDTVNVVKELQKIKNFPQFSRSYNTMGVLDVPAHKGSLDKPYLTHSIRYESPPQDIELISLVVTCSGYNEDDWYDVFVNGEIWWKHWYPSEVKEGLYVGQATLVYELPPSSEILLEWHNVSNVSKRVWFGIRMLSENPIPYEYDNIESTITT